MTENNELSAELLAEKNNNEKLEERLTKYEEMQNVKAGEIQKLKNDTGKITLLSNAKSKKKYHENIN